MLVNDREKYILQDNVRRFDGPFVCTILLLIGLFVPLGVDLNPKLAKNDLNTFFTIFYLQSVPKEMSLSK